MKVAVSFPTTIQLVEKIGAIFGEVHLIGFNGPYTCEKRYEKEFPTLGIDTHFRTEHYSEIDPHEYDLLIDSYETRIYNPEWRECSLKWDIPRILKILWYSEPSNIDFIDNEFEILNKSVVSTENFTLNERWKEAGFENVKMLLYPPGDWWFDGPWTGDIDKALYILSAGPSRDTVSTGLDQWKDLEKRLPENTFHQNGYESFVGSRGLAKMCKEHRCFVNLDQAPVARPLALVFTEVLCSGLPPVIIKQPETDYYKYVKNGVSGFICNDLNDVGDKIKLLCNDYSLAQSMSIETQKIGEENFSDRVLKPEWDEAVKIAQGLVGI